MFGLQNELLDGWRASAGARADRRARPADARRAVTDGARPDRRAEPTVRRRARPWTSTDVVLIVVAVAAGPDRRAVRRRPTPRSPRSPGPGSRSCAREGRRGARALAAVVADRPRLHQPAAAAAAGLRDRRDGAGHAGRADRPGRPALGRRSLTVGGHGGGHLRADRRRAAHARSPAPLPARRWRPPAPSAALARVLGPLASLLILIGNAITPGRGFREGPFSSEVELRELVDMAEQRGVVEEAEREMIQSVFELGDTIVREVMVPRTEVVWIERDKTRAAGAAPGAAQRLLPDPGDRRGRRRRRRRRLPQGPGRAGRRTPSGPGRPRSTEVMRPPIVRAGVQARRRAAAGDAARPHPHGDRGRRVRRHRRARHDRGHPRGDRRRDHRRVRRRARRRSSGSTTAPLRVSARLPVEDLGELFDVELPDGDDVDTVGGLLAQRSAGCRSRGRRGRGRTGCGWSPRAPAAGATGSTPCSCTASGRAAGPPPARRPSSPPRPSASPQKCLAPLESSDEGDA